jgi:hypothetical protein
MPDGYNGKNLHIDLTHRNIAIERPPEEFYRQRSWEATTGRPAREALEQLEIGWVADLLARPQSRP